MKQMIKSEINKISDLDLLDSDGELIVGKSNLNELLEKILLDTKKRAKIKTEGLTETQDQFYALVDSLEFKQSIADFVLISNIMDKIVAKKEVLEIWN